MQVERIDKPRSYPCEKCGAGLEFAPGTSNLLCPYCGHTQQVDTTRNEIRELDFASHFARAQAKQQVLSTEMLEVQCGACGAVSEFHASTAMANCPFCGNHLDSAPHAPEPAILPQGVLPFHVLPGAARDLFSKWVGSLWFAPNALKKLALLGRIEGVYLPYWTYDARSHSRYTGLRGDHYFETQRDSKGNTRMVQKTRWTPTAGTVHTRFDDVLVCASKGLPGPLVAQLEPWDVKAAVDFEPALLSGFKVERYQIDLAEGFVLARGIMAERLAVLIRRDIGGDVQQITSQDDHHNEVTFKHLLLPVWVSAYQYQQKTFRLLINARTGEVQGERPWSWIKITLAVLGALLVLGGAFAIGNALDK